MKRIVKKGLVILISIPILTLSFKNNYVFAKQQQNENKKEISIFEIPDEVEIDSEIIMNLNINQIPYNNFNFKLVSNNSLENIYTENDELDYYNNNEEISFNYFKDNSNLDKISFNYQLPDNVEINDKISFDIYITNLDDNNEVIEEDMLIINSEVNIISNDDKESTIEDNNKEDSKQNVNNENSNNQNNKDSSKKNNVDDDKSNDTKSKKNSISSNKINVNSTQSVSDKSSSHKTSNTTSKDQVKYNGSDNNYLSELSIKGYTLNKEFMKESTTYFVTVNNNVETLDVSALSEDSNSIVTISGNDNLNVGLNKILIMVTSESKETRVYRIYVTKEGSN